MKRSNVVGHTCTGACMRPTYDLNFAVYSMHPHQISASIMLMLLFVRYSSFSRAYVLMGSPYVSIRK